MDDENKKPAHLLVLKIIGFIGIAVAIVGFVMVINGFGDFEHNTFMLGGFLASVGTFVGVACLVCGFRPEIVRLSTKTAKYVQEDVKEDLTDMAETGSKIVEGAVKNITRAAIDGLKQTKFCKYCGAEIDEDSVYCNKCGREQ